MTDAHLPRCKHPGCKTPAMPNSNECGDHWMHSRGWNETTGQYADESLPFEAGAEDTEWDDDMEAIEAYRQRDK